MREMLAWVSKRHGSCWTKTLVGAPGWTEYALYFQFLEMSRELETTCVLRGPNHVLDLERSVWHENLWYKQWRIYDRYHFAGCEGDRRQGPFVAIQSWLSLERWLPKGYTIESFYQALGEWVIRASVEHSDSVSVA
jgi:hypothetical protein